MIGLRREVVLVKKRLLRDVINGSTRTFYHIAMVGLSAALALSLPMTFRFIAKKFLIYWSLIGNDKIFLISVEMILTIFFILLSTYIHKSWKDRKLSNMARAAGMVTVIPSKGFFAKRRVKKLKESQGLARDVMAISSTGFRTFVEAKGELHQVIQNCREAKIMLLNPYSEGATVRAKSIPDPDVTPESFEEQIRKSIDFFKMLKGAQKNVRLKLYHDPPFLKMTILGDYIWLQYYQTGLDVQPMPKYVFKHDQNIGSLYVPLYQYFMGRWNHPDIPEYDLETDELIYRDVAGNEIRRERLNQTKIDKTLNGDLAKNKVADNNDKEEDRTYPPFRTLRTCGSAGDSRMGLRQNLHGGLHPGGKEFFLLRSKNPVCEASGWIAV
jgi:hypothetical protein